MDVARPGDPTLPSGATPDADEDLYRIRVQGFEGPLDLLLHLVRVNQVDITNIPIVEITAQYKAYLDLMRDLNLEVAGEYIVMAATLMHIKSKMLLPPDPTIEESSHEDPRSQLVQQLQEYQTFKQAAENLQAIDSVRELIWTRDGQIPPEFAGEELLVVDLFDLIGAFRKLLGRLDDDTRMQLGRDDVSVADKISWLTEILEERGSIGLMRLFEDLPDRMQRIATFLALLELIRLRLVTAFQTRALGEIWIALRREADGGERHEESGEGDHGPR
jgi:segregation and condensation protein A